MAKSTDGTGGTKNEAWVNQAESKDRLAELAKRIGDQQNRVKDVATLGGKIDRGQHQKQLLGGFGTVRILDSIPAIAKHGPFALPGAYSAAVRVSNGQPCPFADQAQDVRGIAVKFFPQDDRETDLLVTNEGGRSHARNATQFMDIADALVNKIAKGSLDFAGTLLKEVLHGILGPAEAIRSLAILVRETSYKVESTTTEKYWGSVVRLGDAAIRYSLQPHPSTTGGTMGDSHDPDYLRIDLQKRLAKGAIKFSIGLQFFVEEGLTPVNDASVAWTADVIPVGELEIPRLPSPEEEEVVRRMAFNPGNGFEPLGITYARKAVYEASARNRGAVPTSDVRRYFSKPDVGAHEEPS